MGLEEGWALSEGLRASAETVGNGRFTRRALSLISLGLIAAGVKRELADHKPSCHFGSGRTRPSAREGSVDNFPRRNLALCREFDPAAILRNPLWESPTREWVVWDTFIALSRILARARISRRRRKESAWPDRRLHFASKTLRVPSRP